MVPQGTGDDRDRRPAAGTSRAKAKYRQEAQMRFTSLAILVGAALMLTAVPAQAQWKVYISRDFGFSFRAPGEMRAERGTYRAY